MGEVEGLEVEGEERRRRALTGVLYWTFAAQVQIARLRAIQQHFVDGAGNRQVARDDETRRPFMQLAHERHFLLISMANTGKAVGMLKAAGATQQALPAGERRRIRLLRNIFEHWEADPNSPKAQRSLTEFREAFPDTEPTSHSFSTDGAATIGGMSLHDAELTVNALRAWALDLEQAGFVWRGPAQS